MDLYELEPPALEQRFPQTVLGLAPEVLVAQESGPVPRHGAVAAVVVAEVDGDVLDAGAVSSGREACVVDGEPEHVAYGSDVDAYNVDSSPAVEDIAGDIVAAEDVEVAASVVSLEL